MSIRTFYKGSIVKPGLDPLSSGAGHTQYSGLWTLEQQGAAKGAGTWPVPPAPYLFAWGDNVSGMLGLGNVTDISSPVQVGSTADWSVVDAGTDSSAAIKLNNTLISRNHDGYYV
jgi:hypothetical protein